tara:strand:+ start:4320 stop:4481 length:162 start_codon:yes stop_codon:yes gene_type:complete
MSAYTAKEWERIFKQREKVLIFTEIKLKAAEDEIERLTRIIREKESNPYIAVV